MNKLYILSLVKHTAIYYGASVISKEQNVPVKTIYNIVAKYHKRNSISYLPKGGRSKKV